MKIRELTFNSEQEIDKIIEQITRIFELYGCITVADVYDLANIQGGAVADDCYGWFNISKMSKEYDPNDGVYILYMPEACFIKEPKHRTAYNCDTHSGDKMVDHPAHYQSETGLEVIDVIEAFTFDLKGIEATDTGNVIKYICRWKGKNGLQDLKKARWYLNHLINHVEKLEEENRYEK